MMISYYRKRLNNGVLSKTRKRNAEWRKTSRKKKEKAENYFLNSDAFLKLFAEKKLNCGNFFN